MSVSRAPSAAGASAVREERGPQGRSAGRAVPKRSPGHGYGPKVPKLLTADDLAERWQVPRSQVYRLAREGVIPCVPIGRYKRFALDAIEAFENGQRAA